MSKFRWAYIGNGNIANSTSKQILKGEHCIITVYGRNQQKCRDFAKKVGAKPCRTLTEAVDRDDVDGVYIATPHTAHLEQAIKCLNLKKPVLCEKPVGVSKKEAQLLVDTAIENNVYFAEAMWTWFSPVAKKVKEWVVSGEVGEIKNVNIYYSFPGVLMSKNSRVLTPETAGGALLDIGIYPITYCYNLFGYPKKIVCDGTIKNSIDIKEKIILHYDNFQCNLFVSLTSLKESCVIEGTKGSINVPLFHMAQNAHLRNGEKRRVYKGKTDYLTEFDCVADEIKSTLTESQYVPFKSTLSCLDIMDECRKQMGLTYPFENPITKPHTEK